MLNLHCSSTMGDTRALCPGLEFLLTLSLEYSALALRATLLWSCSSVFLLQGSLLLAQGCKGHGNSVKTKGAAAAPATFFCSTELVGRG